MNRLSKYILIISILLTVFASGCTNTNNTTGNTNQGQNPSPSPNGSFASDVIVKVAYQGSWNGSIADNTGNRTVHGTANNNYNLGPNPGTVSVTFQKQGNDTFPLSVQILKGATVIESQVNNESFGVVSIIHVF